jgi:hypothetical protein
MQDGEIMHRVLAATFTLALAACGGGDDFSIEVDRPAARIYGQLSSLDGGRIRQFLGLPAIKRTSPGDGQLLYTIPGGEHGDATLTFRVEPLEQGRSQVHVNLDMPPIKARIMGVEKVLNESRAEDMLERKLEEWANSMKSGSDGHAKILEVDEMLGGLALAMNPEKIGKVIAMANKPEVLAEFLNDRMAWESGPEDRARADAPMSDPDRDAAQYAQPMDRAMGSDPSRDSKHYGDASY